MKLGMKIKVYSSKSKCYFIGEVERIDRKNKTYSIRTEATNGKTIFAKFMVDNHILQLFPMSWKYEVVA